ncbi:ubiquitin-like domain-containing protein [Effusibacillus pohliae]|uniref:ubiquitin-like domain-containing protein n=1 Tax=Effusibacillus pohliae TaxID=232270 RepID=UPI0003759885|nr:ubiquitin-like domain-containing protein [Effusibacillus pohliae]
MRKFSRKSISILAAATAVAAAGSVSATALHKTVFLQVDGQSRKVTAFFSGSVEEFLKKQGIQVTPDDVVQPAKGAHLTEGMNILVRHARHVKIQDGTNEPRAIVTTASTVADVLEQAGIQLGDQDRVNAELNSAPIEGQTITVTRRNVQVAVTEEAIPFQTERQPNQEMYKGQEKLLTPGVEGLAKVTTRIVTENGVEVDREVEKQVVRQPVNAVVTYGTLDRPMVVASRSGGNFAATRKLVMSASAYVAGGRTATGRVAQYGIAAVDPNVIPLGTKLYIEGYGYAIAADTGGAIQGNRIDLVFNSQEECMQFGRRQVVVYIVE